MAPSSLAWGELLGLLHARQIIMYRVHHVTLALVWAFGVEETYLRGRPTRQYSASAGSSLDACATLSGQESNERVQSSCRRERGQNRQGTCCPGAACVCALTPVLGQTSSLAWASESCTAAHQTSRPLVGCG